MLLTISEEKSVKRLVRPKEETVRLTARRRGPTRSSGRTSAGTSRIEGYMRREGKDNVNYLYRKHSGSVTASVDPRRPGRWTQRPRPSCTRTAYRRRPP